MKRCLITGCEGFIGSYLAELVVEKGLPVYGTAYDNTHNIDHLKSKVTLLQCDVKDSQKVEEIINEIKPELVFHLAAQSFVTMSHTNPEETLETNVTGTFYLLESIRTAGLEPLIEVIGSSAVYGPREETGYKPTSMYAVSKIGEETLGYFYHKVYAMKVTRLRHFNMT